MIKAAAAAGVGAWIAPVILDSLASPTAAGTATGNCSVFVFKANRDNGSATCSLVATTCPPTVNSGATLCSGYTGAPNSPVVTPTSVTSGPFACGLASFSVSGTNCGFVGISQLPVVANPTVCPTNVSFTPLNNTPTATATFFLNDNNESIYIFLAVNCGA